MLGMSRPRAATSEASNTPVGLAGIVQWNKLDLFQSLVYAKKYNVFQGTNLTNSLAQVRRIELQYNST